MKRFFIKLVTSLIPNRKKRHLYRNRWFESIREKELSIDAKIKNALDWSINVGDMPKAGGLARVVQMLELDILKDIDRVCRKHNLRYWLDYGTLLGAVRHKGFIPWDDDVDISMPYEDFLKFKEIAPQELGEDYVYTYPPGFICRVMHKDFGLITEEDICGVYKRYGWRDTQRIFFHVDIFPIRYAKEELSRQQLSDTIQKGIARKKELRTYNEEATFAAWQRIADEIYDDYELPISSDTPTSRMFMSLDCTVQPKPRIYMTEDIFPLREIEFEGHQFYAPGQTEMWLFTCFGEYWKPYIVPAHNDLKKLTREQMKKLIAWGREHGHL